MCPSKAYVQRLLRLIAYPATVAIVGLGLFSQIARPAREVAVQLIVVNSRENAQSIVDRLKAGIDFGVLAREESVDATATDGGLLGRIDPAALRPELRD